MVCKNLGFGLFPWEHRFLSIQTQFWKYQCFLLFHFLHFNIEYDFILFMDLCVKQSSWKDKGISKKDILLIYLWSSSSFSSVCLYLCLSICLSLIHTYVCFCASISVCGVVCVLLCMCLHACMHAVVCVLNVATACQWVCVNVRGHVHFLLPPQSSGT